MATLAIPSSSAARSASRQTVEIVPRQIPTVSISSAPSLASVHYDLPPPPVSPDFADFPDSVLDFEELVEVDELLTELGMTPPMSGYAEDDGAAVSEVSDDQYQEGLLPPFQTTATTSAVPPPEAPASSEPVKSTSPPVSVVRTVSMDQVAFASISGSVPNPMANIPFYDEPPTKKQKVYTPLLPNPLLSTSTTTAITTSATKITKPVTTTTTSTKTIKKIATTTSKPKATIAKSSSIPSLLPPSILSSTAARTVINPAVSNGRKRKLTRKEQELNMSAEELEERRERNRSHAKKSRQRKKAMTELLQESVQSLQQANQILRDGLNMALGNNYAESYLQSREEQSKDAFLQALKNPANRVVDAAGLAFLKKLQKRIPKDNSMEADDDEA